MTNSGCIVSQTFIISYLMHQSKTFKTLIEKNAKSLRFKNFRWFRGLALHYDSTESAESWENFVILAEKRLDYFLTELKLISNPQNQQKTGSGQLFTWQITTDFTWYKNWYILSNSCCIAPQTFIISYLTYQSSIFNSLIKKNEKSSRFKDFPQFRGFALHYGSAESVESWEILNYYQIKGWINF